MFRKLLATILVLGGIALAQTNKFAALGSNNPWTGANIWNTTSVPFSTTPAFDASNTNAFTITLTNNVSSSTLTGGTQGQWLMFDVCQDATGGRTFAWPANVKNGATIATAANSCTDQVFYYDGTNAQGISVASGSVNGSNLTTNQLLCGAGGSNIGVCNLSGDATTSGSGVVTVTKTNGVAFAASATSDTTNAANIISGILPIARLTKSGNGTEVVTGVSGINTALAGTLACMDGSGNLTVTSCTVPSGGTPGGSSPQLEFNNAGVFGGVTGSSVSGANLTLGGSLVLNPSASIVAGVVQISPADIATPGLVVNTPTGSTADIVDFNNNGVKQWFVDASGKANFQASSVTSASFNMPFGQAPSSCPGVVGSTTGCVGDWYFISPSTIQYVDANNTLQDVVADQIANIFQKQNTFVQPNATTPEVVIRSFYPSTSIPANASDIMQIQDSTGAVQIEITKDFGFVASYFKTNGLVSGTQEFTATGTDPLSSFALDSNSIRFDAPTNLTTSFRVGLPSADSGSTTPAVWLFSTGCASQTVNGHAAITCPSTFGQVPNGALVNSGLTVNGVALTLGGSFNLGQLNDSSGNPTIESVATASAKGYLTVSNPSVSTPTITISAATVAGGPSNINIDFEPAGTGQVLCKGVSCGGGGGGGTSLAVNGTAITGSTGSFGTSTSIIGNISTQVTVAQHVGDAMAVQFGADTSTPTTNIIGYMPGVIVRPHYRRTAWIEATGASISNLGDAQATTGTTTHIAATNADPTLDNFATTTTSGSNAGIIGGTILRTGRNIHYESYVELLDEASGLQRAWWGLSSTSVANMLGSDTPAFSFAAFRFSTVAADTTYKCVVGNGTTTTVKDTAVTADANGHYFDIVFDDTTGNIQCLVDGVVKATFANTDAVPAASTNLAQFTAIQTETTATRDIREAWMLSTSDK